MNTRRIDHTATLLPNGKVIVAGGSIYGQEPTNATELYDPVSGTWTLTGSLSTARYGHTATLLPNGKVLVVAGNVFDGYATNTTELYDPASGTWTATRSLSTARERHTATLLPNGKVLVAGGSDNPFVPHYLSSAELFDVGLGYSNAWQPTIATIPSPLVLGAGVFITGLGFRGISEASGANNSQDSASDYPVVQFYSIDNEQTLYLANTNWSTNSILSPPVSGLPPGWTLATVFVNGIPSQSTIVRLVPPATAIVLTNPAQLPGGVFQFGFTNVSGAVFTALATTNLSLALSNWTVLGSATEIADGQFQFSDPQATNYPRRFYDVRSP
jgi:hypothetical protein